MAIDNGTMSTPLLSNPGLQEPASSASTMENGGIGDGEEELYKGVKPSTLFNTSPETGLSAEEAEARLEQFGKNELTDDEVSQLLKLVKRFISPMAIMIWLAIVIEGITKDWLNVGVLLVLQILNALVGWFEDFKSASAVTALKSQLKPSATVKRDGRVKTINATLLVPGDIVLLGAGQAVPADVTICPGQKPLAVDQAALTGESLPVTMYPDDVVKMGSNITRGEVTGVVTASGDCTFFGKTASLIASVDEIGHFEKIVLQITIALMVMSIVVVIICLIYLLVQGDDALEAISFCVVLLVASIPIAMQVVCTSTMALGCRALASEGAIVTRLSSIEELAGINMLCSDKTGTLTLNRMALQDEIHMASDGIDKKDLCIAAAMATRWNEPAKDAIDTLVLDAVKGETALLDQNYTQIDFVPFDPSIKRSESTLEKKEDGTTFMVTKGAPQVILSLAYNRADIEADVEARILMLAQRGIRALAIARTNEEAGGWVFLGMLTFLDPPRPDTKTTIERTKQNGIEVKMVTGDQRAIAVETCRVLGMGMNVMGVDQLPKAGSHAPTDSALKTLGHDYGEMIEHADGFAQVYPEHKFFIVEALRQRGWVVAMTGDGVNDAPALKRADVGVAVEGATDAARAAADIVFTQPGLGTIVTAIIVAREIFQRMKNYVIYRIACTIELLIFFFIAALAFHPDTYNSDWPGYFKIPVIGLVVITLLNDGTIISIAYDRVIPGARPEKWALVQLFIVAAVLGSVAMLSSLLLLWMVLENGNTSGLLYKLGMHETFDYPQVMMCLYLKVSLSDFMTIFSARTHSFFFTRLPGTALFIAFIVATLVSTILSHYWPFGDMRGISWKMCGFIWAFCAVWFLVTDALKVVTYSVLWYTGVSHSNKDTEAKLKGRQIREKLRAHGSFVTRSSYSDAQPLVAGEGIVTFDTAMQRIGVLEGELQTLKQHLSLLGSSSLRTMSMRSGSMSARDAAPY